MPDLLGITTAVMRGFFRSLWDDIGWPGLLLACCAAGILMMLTL